MEKIFAFIMNSVINRLFKSKGDFTVLILSVIFCVYYANSINKSDIPTIKNQNEINAITTVIDSSLRQLGTGVFISRIRLERKKSGDYAYIWNDIRCLGGPRSIPQSIMDSNIMYRNEGIIDKNTEQALLKLGETDVLTVNPEIVRQKGYTIMCKLYARTKIPLKFTKISAVKLSDDLIYVFLISFAFDNCMSDMLQESILLEISSKQRDIIINRGFI